MDGQQFLAKIGQRPTKHGLDRTVVTLDQEFQQAPQPLGLGPGVVAGRPNQFLKFFFGDTVQGLRGQQVGLAGVADRPFDVLPVRICTRMAPTIISKWVSPGHQFCGPKASSRYW